MKRDDRRQIWKFPLRVADEQTVEMPTGALILAVQVQNDKPCIWADVWVQAKKVARTFYVVATGHSMPTDANTYVGTFLLKAGALAFHVWEK